MILPLCYRTLAPFIYKKIIGDGAAAKEIRAGEMLQQLLVPLGHKKQLHREGVAHRLLVEKRQEGIVGKLFEDQRATRTGSQPVAQGRFARADISLDCNKWIC